MNRPRDNSINNLRVDLPAVAKLLMPFVLVLWRISKFTSLGKLFVKLLLGAQTTRMELWVVFFQELNANGTGYLVGASATMADAALLELVLFIKDYWGEAELDRYSGIKVSTEVTKVAGNPRLWLSSIVRPSAKKSRRPCGVTSASLSLS